MLRLAVNSTPGRGRLCTQWSGLVGARGLAQAGRRSLWWWGGTLVGRGLSVHAWTIPGPLTAARGNRIL